MRKFALHPDSNANIPAFFNFSRQTCSSYMYLLQSCRPVCVFVLDIPRTDFLTTRLKFIIVKPVLSDHIKHTFVAFQTGGCLLLYESSAQC